MFNEVFLIAHPLVLFFKELKYIVWKNIFIQFFKRSLISTKLKIYFQSEICSSYIHRCYFLFCPVWVKLTHWRGVEEQSWKCIYFYKLEIILPACLSSVIWKNLSRDSILSLHTQTSPARPLRVITVSYLTSKQLEGHKCQPLWYLHDIQWLHSIPDTQP